MSRWTLWVYYPTAGDDGYFWGQLDAAIVQATGKLDSGRGTTLETGVRDMSFWFSTESAARNARKRVLALRKKGLRTEVCK